MEAINDLCLHLAAQAAQHLSHQISIFNQIDSLTAAV